MKGQDSGISESFTSSDPFVAQVREILVVNCFRTDLNVSWCIEYANLLRTYHDSKIIKIVDMSRHNVVNESQKRVFFWQALTGTLIALQAHLSDWSNKNGVAFLKCTTPLLPLFIPSIWPTLRITLSRNPQEFLALNDNQFLLRSIHSSMANLLGTTEYRPYLHPLSIFRRVLAFLRAERTMMQLLHQHPGAAVMLPNGRYPAVAGALLAAKDQAHQVRLMERGGSPGMLNVFSESPHSMVERRQSLIQQNLIKGNSFPKMASEISKTYFELRRDVDPASGIKWQDGADLEISSALRSKAIEKKLLVFFTSTELEFAVFNEGPNKKYFASQRGAVSSLLATINFEEYTVVIRRHPQTRWSLFDRERKLWSEVKKKYPIHWIGPRSKVNSFELGLNADVIVHFNSGIGPEFLVLNHQKVITLGATPWLPPELESSCGSWTQIQQALQSKRTMDEEKKWALDWGFHQVIIGTLFQEVEWRSGRAQFGVTKQTASITPLRRTEFDALRQSSVILVNSDQVLAEEVPHQLTQHRWRLIVDKPNLNTRYFTSLCNFALCNYLAATYPEFFEVTVRQPAPGTKASMRSKRFNIQLRKTLWNKVQQSTSKVPHIASETCHDQSSVSSGMEQANWKMEEFNEVDPKILLRRYETIINKIDHAVLNRT